MATLRDTLICKVTDAVYNEALATLNDPNSIYYYIYPLRPGLCLGAFGGPEYDIDKGIIALEDGYDFLWDSYWYLLNTLCMYRKELPLEEVVTIRRFLEPAYLTIYSSLECCANALRCILRLEIGKNPDKVGGETLFSKVGRALRDTLPDDPITVLAQSLFKEQSIQEIIRYRNNWVHNQRIQLREEPRPLRRDLSLWEKTEKGHRYVVGSKFRISYHTTLTEYIKTVRDAYNTFHTFFLDFIEVIKTQIETILDCRFSMEEVRKEDGTLSKRYSIHFPSAIGQGKDKNNKEPIGS